MALLLREKSFYWGGGVCRWLRICRRGNRIFQKCTWRKKWSIYVTTGCYIILITKAADGETKPIIASKPHYCQNVFKAVKLKYWFGPTDWCTIICDIIRYYYWSISMWASCYHCQVVIRSWKRIKWSNLTWSSLHLPQRQHNRVQEGWSLSNDE